MGKKKGSTDAKKAGKKAAKMEQKKAAKEALRQALNPRDISGSLESEHQSPTPPPSETIFTLYPQLRLLLQYYADCQSLGCKEGSRISTRWLRMRETERTTIIDNALKVVLEKHVGGGTPLPNASRSYIQEILSDKRAFSGDKNPIRELDLIPHLFNSLTSDYLAANPQSFLRLAHARTLHHPRAYSRTDFVRIVEPLLSVFYKLSRATEFMPDDAEGGDSASAGKQRSVVVLSTWALDVEENPYWGSLFRYPSDHFRFKAESAVQTIAHPYDAMWVFGYQMVMMGLIKEVMLRILGLKGYDSTTAREIGEEGEERDMRYYEDTLQNLLIGLPPKEDMAAALRTSSPTYNPIFDKDSTTDIALACCRHATDRLYFLMTDPALMIQAINYRLEFRFEHVADMQGNLHGDVRSRDSVNDCIAHVIWHTTTRAVMWNRICCALEEINLRKFQDEKDDASLCSIRHILEDLVDYALDDIRRYMMCGPVLRRFFYIMPEKPRLWRQLASPSDLYPFDPINGLLLCLSSIFENRKELDWVHKVLDVRFVITEIELHLKRDPCLEKNIPGFIMGFLSEVGAAFQLMDMLELHRPDTWPDEQYPTVALAGKLRSLCSVLQSRLGAVDMTAILRDGDAMTNLEDYILPKGSDGVRRPNLTNYEKFWKLHNMKMKKECSFTIETWFQKCGDGIVFERSRGYWHGKDGCWKGEGLEVGSTTTAIDDSDNINPEAQTLGYHFYGSMDVEAKEEELIENQFEAILSVSYLKGDYISDSDYDEDLRWPGLPPRHELKAKNKTENNQSGTQGTEHRGPVSSHKLYDGNTTPSPVRKSPNSSTDATTGGGDGMPILFSDEDYWSTSSNPSTPSSSPSLTWEISPLDTAEAWTAKHHPETFAWDEQCKLEWIKELESRLIAEQIIQAPSPIEQPNPLGYNLSHEVTYGPLVDVRDNGDVLDLPGMEEMDLPHPHIRFATIKELDKWLDEQPDGLLPENMWIHQDDPLVVEYIAPQRARALTNIDEDEVTSRKSRPDIFTLNGIAQETYDIDKEEADFWAPDVKISEMNKKVLASIDSYPWMRAKVNAYLRTPPQKNALTSKTETTKSTTTEIAEEISNRSMLLNGHRSTSVASFSSDDTVIHHSVAETPIYTVPTTLEQRMPSNRTITDSPEHHLELDDAEELEQVFPDEPYPSELRESRNLRQTFIYIPPPTDKSQWPIAYLSLSGYEILQALSLSQPVSWDDFVLTMNELGFKFSKIGGARHVMIPEMVVDERFVIERPYVTGVWSGDEAGRVWRRLESAYGFDLDLFWCEEFDERGWVGRWETRY